MSAIGVALIGAGDIALTAHLPAIARRTDVELRWIVDPSATARRSAEVHPNRQGAHVVGSPAEVARDDGVQALIVATPPWVTTGVVAQALQAGRFVLAEKPVAPTTRHAEPLTELAEEQRRRLQIGFTYRHDRPLERLAEWIADGRLGTPLLTRIAVYDEALGQGGEHERRVRAHLEHGPPIVHEGAHIADWIHVLLGRGPSIEHAWSMRTVPDLPEDNVSGASLAYENGNRVLIEVGWLLPAPRPASAIIVCGPGGVAELDIPSFDLRFSGPGGIEQHVGLADRMTRCFDRQLERFVALCRGDGSRSPGLDEALASLRLTEALAAAARR